MLLISSNITKKIIDKINSIDDYSKLTPSNIDCLVGCSDSQVRRRAGAVLKNRKAIIKSTPKTKIKPLN